VRTYERFLALFDDSQPRASTSAIAYPRHASHGRAVSPVHSPVRESAPGEVTTPAVDVTEWRVDITPQELHMRRQARLARGISVMTCVVLLAMIVFGVQTNRSRLR
jgi:hypothetical protein